MSLDPLLQKRYESESINPETKAFALINGEIYLTVAGMELKAMRSGMLCGKLPVVFGEEVDATDPHTGKPINVPTTAVATYKRFCMDIICEFSSDPVHFFEYANKRWHYEKPFMFLAKIARACALRHTFPDIFAGVVSYEEAQSELNFSDKSMPVTVVLTDGGPVREEAQYKKVVQVETIPSSPKAVSDMVAAIFKQGVQS